jgi:hypothetical protein
VGFGTALATTDGGSTWTAQVETGDLFDITCPTSLTCFAVGSGLQGVALTTTDGGTNWTSQSVPTGIEGIGSVSCPSTTLCFSTATGEGKTGATILSQID